MPSGETHSEAFGARIDAIEALMIVVNGAPDGATPELSKVVDALVQAASTYGDADTAFTYAGYAELVSISASLVQWRKSVLDADANPDRHLRSARERYRIWLSRYSECSDLENLRDLDALLQDAASIDNVVEFARRLTATPLAIGLFSKEPKSRFHNSSDIGKGTSKPEPLAVAFLEFFLDDQPVSEIQFLPHGIVHDLSIKVRVSRWPQGAERLVLTPVSVDSSSLFAMPTFEFNFPTGEAPFILHKTDRAILKVPLSLGARPLEIKYAAEFQPIDVEQPVEVAGQRSLRLEGADWRRSPQSGYPKLDQRLIDIRNHLKKIPGIPEAELADALTVLVALSNLAGQAVQDSRFEGKWSEAQFQMDLRKHLRDRPAIGSELMEHPRATGGITDFIFRKVPIELKSETDRTLAFADCQQFVGQTVSYAVGNGVSIGILCVLDTSEKTDPPFPMEHGLGLLEFAHPDDRVPIIGVLIQGNIPRPSSHSR